MKKGKAKKTENNVSGNLENSPLMSMMMFRAEKYNELPPPSYDRKTNQLTLAIYCGGEFVHVPVGRYFGGSLFKYDCARFDDIKASGLKNMCENIGISEIKGFYFLIKGGFKLVQNGVELCKIFNAVLKSKVRELHLYVDGKYTRTKGREPRISEVEIQSDCESNADSENPDGERVELEHFSDSDFNMASDTDSEAEDMKNAMADDILFKEYVDHNVMDKGDDLSSAHTTMYDGYGEVEEVNNLMLNIINDDYESDYAPVFDPGEDDIIESGDDFNSASDSDGENYGPRLEVFNKADMFDPKFKVGLKFCDKSILRKAINCHAVKHRRNVHIPTNDRKRLYAYCRARRCQWKVIAAKVNNESSWWIKDYVELHTCPKETKIKNLRSSYAAERFLHKFVSDPTRKMEGFVRDVCHDTHCAFTARQGYRTKALALKIIRGDADKQYGLAHNYKAEVLRTNPGSTVLVSPDENGEFDRMYVCLAAMKEGMLSGCRPIVGVDACHLWGPHKGVLMTAVGVDPNNNTVPFAWALVDKENYDNWKWFLLVLKSDLQITNCDRWTFMFDKQKGLLLAFDEVFPKASNRFCVRHLHGNFKKAGFGGSAFKDALWNAARCTTKNSFKRCMKEMEAIDPKAVPWFDDKPASQWSKSHFNFNSKCDMLLNNGCETFNKVIKEARAKPILRIFEWLHDYVLTRNRVNRDRAANKWNFAVCPKIRNLVDKSKSKAGDGIAIKAGADCYKIEKFDGSHYVVRLNDRTCTCRRWELTGIPCGHAVCAMNAKGVDAMLYVSQVYAVETYKKVYNPIVFPVRSCDEWPETNFKPIKPPNSGLVVGRPGSARRLEEGEVPSKKKKKQVFSKVNPTKLKKQQESVKCGFCKKIKHNIRTCVHKKEFLRTGIPYVIPGEGTSGEQLNEPVQVDVVEEPIQVETIVFVSDVEESAENEHVEIAQSQPGEIFIESQPLLAPNEFEETLKERKLCSSSQPQKVTRAKHRYFKQLSRSKATSTSPARVPSASATPSQLLLPQPVFTAPTMHEQIIHSQQGTVTQDSLQPNTIVATRLVNGRSGREMPIFANKPMGKITKY